MLVDTFAFSTELTSRLRALREFQPTQNRSSRVLENWSLQRIPTPREFELDSITSRRMPQRIETHIRILKSGKRMLYHKRETSPVDQQVDLAKTSRDFPDVSRKKELWKWKMRYLTHQSINKLSAKLCNIIHFMTPRSLLEVVNYNVCNCPTTNARLQLPDYREAAHSALFPPSRTLNLYSDSSPHSL